MQRPAALAVLPFARLGAQDARTDGFGRSVMPCAAATSSALWMSRGWVSKPERAFRALQPVRFVRFRALESDDISLHRKPFPGGEGSGWGFHANGVPPPPAPAQRGGEKSVWALGHQASDRSVNGVSDFLGGVGEAVADLGAEALDPDQRGDRDHGGDETVFDRGVTVTGATTP